VAASSAEASTFQRVRRCVDMLTRLDFAESQILHTARAVLLGTVGKCMQGYHVIRVQALRGGGDAGQR
jgi:hypothetical protein